MHKKIPIFDLYKQYQNLKPEIDRLISDIIKNSAFINGEANRKFEIEFAKFCGIKRVVGVGSGSVALDLSLIGLGVKPGDEAICPTHTFAATAEAIAHCGAKPVFVDCQEDTYLMDPKLVESAVTKKTTVIIVVHLYGQPVDMTAINKIAKKYKLKIIEDAAQAHGAKYKNKPIGNFSDATCFSFFPAKNLGCYGDGGAIATNNSRLANYLSKMKDHGRISKYEHQFIGYGERLDNLQAAILLAKLPHLSKWNQRRNQIASRYSLELADFYTIPIVKPDRESVYYVYTLRHKQRDLIMKYLSDKGIETGIYYPKPLHLQPAFSYLGYKKGDLPVSEKISQEIFSVPIYPELTDGQVKFIINTLKKASISVE